MSKKKRTSFNMVRVIPQKVTSMPKTWELVCLKSEGRSCKKQTVCQILKVRLKSMMQMLSNQTKRELLKIKKIWRMALVARDTLF